MEENDVVRSGYLQKKRGKINTWAQRYFVLRKHSLDYYMKQSDSEPKGSLPLHPSCTVSAVQTDTKGKKKQYVFKLVYKIDEEGEDIKEDSPGGSSLTTPDKATAGKDNNKRLSKKDGKKDEKGLNPGTKVAAAAMGGVMLGALTSGIGLLAGMMVVGAAAGGSAVAMTHNNEGKERYIFLAADSQALADQWVTDLETQIQSSSESIISNLPKRKKPITPMFVHPESRIDEVEDWMNHTKWKVYDVHKGLRLLQPDYEEEEKQNLLTCLRANVTINASAFDAFSYLSNFSNSMKAGIIHSIRVVASIENNTDILHIKLNPVFLYPTWTAPRDFCVVRYWREIDKMCVICLDSTVHDDCPPLEGYVRGDLHAAYVMTPPKHPKSPHKVHNRRIGDMDDEEDDPECLLSLVAQMDPKGWIWKSYGYQEQFLKEFMLQVFDIRECLEADRFLQYHYDPTSMPSVNIPSRNEDSAETEKGSIGTIPPPILSPHMFAESDASTFKVRGLTYNQDKHKVSSAPSLFKLLAVDLFEVPETTKNIAAHPRNRVYLGLQRGDPAWVFLVNIMVPGPPYLSFVAYFQGDKALIDADTPFGRVARPFFYGNDDEYRNNRFKLIPKILDGNLIIKMAVKDTPTLLGNKLKQYYFKGENYFELDVDVGSSSVARNVVGLAMGYSKAIVVDMGFCLQGNEEDELPEVLMGGCTGIHVDAATAKKL